MSTFFGQIKQFQRVPENNRINTQEFLETCRQCITMFDMFGKGFGLVKSDMKGNIESLARKYSRDPEKYATLVELLPDDDNEEKDVGLSALWLKRALEFISVFLCKVIHDYRNGIRSKSLVPMATVAYEETLKPYHGWFTQKAFTLVTQFAPYTDSFIKSLANGNDNMMEQVMCDMEVYEPLLTENVAAFDCLIRRYGLNNDDKV